MLEELVVRYNEIRRQQDADAAEASLSDVASAAMEAPDARIFVDQLHRSLSEVLPQVGPKLRRAVNYRPWGAAITRREVVVRWHNIGRGSLPVAIARRNSPHLVHRQPSPGDGL